jgi:KDO2-lipid IV(A) lauroyltransferase
VRKERIKTLNNLRFAFGKEKSEKELHRIAREVFANLGRNVVELINFPKITEANIDSLVQEKGLHHINKGLRRQKGIVILASHFGNWELLAAYLTLKGYRGPVIARRIYFDKYDQALRRLRASKNVEVIYRDESPKKILKVLKSGGMVGVLADQDVDSVEGVFVDFFGKLAYTPVAPASLALATEAAILPCFLIREGSKRTFVVEKPVELEITGNKERDIATNTQKWSHVLESYIRKYPSQWVWMHKRWKTRPDA